MTRPNDDFPRRCCVLGCPTVVYNPHDADRKLFRFARRAKTHSVNSDFNELIERRFWKWINVLGQNPRKAQSLWICSEHFVSGRPAAAACHWDVDWIPNQNLKSRKKQAAKRLRSKSQTKCNRNKNESVLGIEQTHEETSYSSEGGPFCRLCLRKHVNLRPVFPSPRVDDNDVVRVVEQVANIRLEFEADYNSFVCCDCLKKLEDFYRCREVWQSNDALIKAFRTKESSINPAPIEHLSEESVQEIDDTDTFYPAPIPIVAIPIEHLIHGTEAVNAIAWHRTSDASEYENHDEMQQGADVFSDVHDTKYSIDSDTESTFHSNLKSSVKEGAVNDSKQPVELVSNRESTLNQCSNATLSVKEEPQDERDSDVSETAQKEKMIKQLMKKIRRETLSPKKKKSKKCSKRRKRQASERTYFDIVGPIDIDKG